MRSIRQLVAYADSCSLHLHSDALPFLRGRIRFCLSREFKPVSHFRGRTSSPLLDPFAAGSTAENS